MNTQEILVCEIQIEVIVWVAIIIITAIFNIAKKALEASKKGNPKNFEQTKPSSSDFENARRQVMQMRRDFENKQNHSNSNSNKNTYSSKPDNVYNKAQENVRDFQSQEDNSEIDTYEKIMLELEKQKKLAKKTASLKKSNANFIENSYIKKSETSAFSINKQDLKKGIILSEILNKPVSLRN